MKQPKFDKNRIDEPGINDFVYTLIYNLSGEQRRNLPAYLYRQINTAKKALRFANKSSTDQKRELLSYLDIGFFWTFVGIEKITAKEFLPILKEFKKGNPVSSIKEMCEKGVYVTSDREYAFLLDQMARVTTTGGYVKNYELMRVGYRLRKWPKKITYQNQSEDEHLIYSSRVMADIIASVITNFKFVDSITGLPQNDYRILQYFYIFRDRYITNEDLDNVFLGDIPKRNISFGQTNLLKKLLIQSHADHRKKEYTITKLGIRTVHQFRDRVLKSFNF